MGTRGNNGENNTIGFTTLLFIAVSDNCCYDSSNIYEQ